MTNAEVLLQLIDRAMETAPAHPKLQNQLSALRTEVTIFAQSAEANQQALAEYEEAYEKLTKPANKVGVLLELLADGTALIVQGGSDYVVLLDPKLDASTLEIGQRVLLNEAFAVIATMDHAGSGALTKVVEAFPDGRLRVGGDAQGQGGRLVMISQDLAGAKIRKGDDVRLDSNERCAIEHFPASETRDYFVEEIEPVPWDAIGGQDDALSVIRESIEHPMLYPEIYERFGKKPVKGILLYGPPGCGKTLIGKATAFNLAKDYSGRLGHEVKECFLHISGPKVLNMWLGETERMIREIFDVARKRAKDGQLVVIFIDEAESILRTRSSGRYLNISNTVVPQFCAEMDGMVALENVVVILTSNRPDYIDPAILRPERIDRKVKVRRPDRAGAKGILGLYLDANLPIDPALVALHDGPECARQALIAATLEYLWRDDRESEFLEVSTRSGGTQKLYRRDLVSGALLKSVVDRAKDMAIRRAIEDPKIETGVSIGDLEAAIDMEYRENEIFPKGDVMEDWLRMIDFEPESVVAVRPIGERKGRDYLSRSIV